MKNKQTKVGVDFDPQEHAELKTLAIRRKVPMGKILHELALDLLRREAGMPQVESISVSAVRSALLVILDQLEQLLVDLEPRIKQGDRSGVERHAEAIGRTAGESLRRVGSAKAK